MKHGHIFLCVLFSSKYTCGGYFFIFFVQLCSKFYNCLIYRIIVTAQLLHNYCMLLHSTAQHCTTLHGYRTLFFVLCSLIISMLCVYCTTARKKYLPPGMFSMMVFQHKNTCVYIVMYLCCFCDVVITLKCTGVVTLKNTLKILLCKNTAYLCSMISFYKRFYRLMYRNDMIIVYRYPAIRYRTFNADNCYVRCIMFIIFPIYILWHILISIKKSVSKK